MAEVVVGRCHGGWGPDEGWVQVPRGTTVYLFLDSFRTMKDTDADRSTLMSVEELQALQSRASQTVTEFRTVCNYGIESLNDNDVPVEGPMQQGVELFNEDGKHLSDVFARYQGSPNNVYWFACQSLDGLNETGEDIDQDKVQRFN